MIPSGSGVVWTSVVVLCDQPLGIVAVDEDADGVPDVVDGLTGNEIRFLDTITRRLMDRRRDGRGYVIGTRRK